MHHYIYLEDFSSVVKKIYILPSDVHKSWIYFIIVTRIHNVRKRMQDEARESGLPDCMIPADSITVYAQVRVTRRNLFFNQSKMFDFVENGLFHEKDNCMKNKNVVIV